MTGRLQSRDGRLCIQPVTAIVLIIAVSVLLWVNMQGVAVYDPTAKVGRSLRRGWPFPYSGGPMYGMPRGVTIALSPFFSRTGDFLVASVFVYAAFLISNSVANRRLGRLWPQVGLGSFIAMMAVAGLWLWANLVDTCLTLRSPWEITRGFPFLWMRGYGGTSGSAPSMFSWKTIHVFYDGGKYWIYPVAVAMNLLVGAALLIACGSIWNKIIHSWYMKGEENS